jgi:hypothetical protein
LIAARRNEIFPSIGFGPSAEVYFVDKYGQKQRTTVVNGTLTHYWISPSFSVPIIVEHQRTIKFGYPNALQNAWNSS